MGDTLKNSRWVIASRNRALVRLAVTLATAVLACSGSRSPRVELMENGVYIRKNVRSYHLSGARDGATTHATALIALDEGDTVQIDMNVTYNPTPELATAHWRRKGKTAEEGDVHAESLKFLGGQGGTPSVGGRFRLDSFGKPRMRISLPARPLEKPLH